MNFLMSGEPYRLKIQETSKEKIRMVREVPLDTSNPTHPPKEQFMAKTEGVLLTAVLDMIEM